MPAPTLNFYLQQTQLLLNDVAQAEYNVADLTTYINIGRGQIATAAQCIRYTGTLTTAATQQDYPIVGFSTPAGVEGAISEPRLMSLRTTGNNRTALEKRNWEWFWIYELCRAPLRTPGPPAVWSQEEPGTTGAISFSPIPDTTYIVDANLIGYPIDLASNTDPEAIPYPWTDSVPYFGAFWALMNTQRQSDAQLLEQRWVQFMTWAGRQVTSTVMPSYDPGGRSAMMAAAKIPSTGVGVPAAPGRGGGGTPPG
jgi:hypothetical protein